MRASPGGSRTLEVQTTQLPCVMGMQLSTRAADADCCPLEPNPALLDAVYGDRSPGAQWVSEFHFPL